MGGAGGAGGASLSQLFSSNLACPFWASADEEPPDFRNPGLRWAKGQAQQPCPACPQEPLGSAQASSLPALEL